MTIEAVVAEEDEDGVGSFAENFFPGPPAPPPVAPGKVLTIGLYTLQLVRGLKI